MNLRFGGDATRFLLAGGLNTALTSVVYFVCLVFTSPTASYALAWAAGVCFVMAVYPDRVFIGGARSVRARIALGLLTIGAFVAGILLLRALVALTGEDKLAFLATVVATTVLNFVGGRLLLRGY